MLAVAIVESVCVCVWLVSFQCGAFASFSLKILILLSAQYFPEIDHNFIVIKKYKCRLPIHESPCVSASVNVSTFAYIFTLQLF